MSNKRYTDEFKREAVRQVAEHKHSTVEVAHRLGINKHSLYAWVRDYGPATPNPAESAVDLAVVLDLFSRQIVGWSMQSQMTRDVVMNALLMAVWRRKPKAGVMIHSD